mmetsp:Transcript_3533/g.7618  ORF Transcript_3533/g.7618 Transcript_3533/m.7618 type:complete len:276 (-) Transcript_3533:375-1202(-)|eukprot:CAMPEP_0183297896 /NCGR_PEP_ID=MMETSP0160_2-20130417/5059_1 /TAXON_ID=2839 ORGANISM="Odontella Sinensis, Strain Grunow 1884" /NCGR_SAMPLE_ID=MMETSP0160_2 /ASSEMBLY_ACC=CAM_ASM_000250 /LENGTH=275 /DNA_ID=CAMNT_0025459793 /DNA_START=81 /DNA_END=908 /DNA_ORIENTATION=-
MFSNFGRALSRQSQRIGSARSVPVQQALGPIRSLFIQTESTPNPESIKFLPGKPVLDVEEGGDAGNGFYCTKQDKEEIARSPLSQKIFDVDGVKSVYLGRDFVTVTKYAEGNWAHIRTPVFAAIMDHYATGKPALAAVAEVTDTTIFDDDSEVVALIKEILEARIRPAVQEDGGDIRYAGFDEETGIVQVKLAGSCVGCPSSSVTLKNGVENMLMHYIEEVTAVHAIEDEDGDDSGANGVLVEKTEGSKQDNGAGEKKMKTYEERLAAAGIPFSD